ncbi:uridine kinase [Actinophytocola sp.]|uniref:uridine kinase n=1 Tax=Actinophytocola sp. TaxID=1872138 RepID=UPI002EDB1CB9
MRFRPVSPDLLVDEVADRVLARPATAWTRVAVDGAPPARPGDLADRLAEAVRLRGRPALRVSAADFLRPASLRFERGRLDPDARYADWLDAGGLVREVLAPLGPDGPGRVLPALWNAATDRSSRASYVSLPPGGVLVLDGELLLGRGLPLEYTVHLWLSGPALARVFPETWALPAFSRYDHEVRPLHTADTGVRVDDPQHPALLDDSPV